MSQAARVEVDDEPVIPLEEVPARMGDRVSMRSVRDRRWRQHVGLRVVRIGRKILGVREADLLAAMRRGF